MLNVRRRPGNTWYFVTMILLYAFHILFGLSAIAGAVYPDRRGIGERLIDTALFVAFSILSWAFGRMCSAALSRSRPSIVPGSDSRLSRVLKILY